MKKPFTLLPVIAFVAAVLFSPSAASAQGCLGAWQYQMPITIDNTGGSALTDYEMLLTIDTQTPISVGRMESNGSDIRFTDGSCCNTLCYYIESGINTATTQIWVKIPAIPANGTTNISMFFGNSGAPAGSDGTCAFAFFDGFDGPTTTFTNVCGNTTETLSGGNLDLSWSSSGMIQAPDTFPVGNVYTFEAWVNSASGTWPGIYWAKNATKKSYGMLINATQARISVTGGGTDWCSGHNWASALQTYSGVNGLWSLTWEASANLYGDFPTVGQITSTDNTYNKDEDLRLLIGGISSGSGSINLDWIRVRQIVTNPPTATYGSTVPFNAGPSVDLGNDTTVCPGTMVTFNGTDQFTSYSWNNGSTDSTITVDTVATYILTATSSNGCASVDTVMLNNFVVTQVDLGPDSTICPNSAITLDAGAGGSSYVWSDGSNTSSIVVGQGGTYTVLCTDANSCTSSDTVVVAVASGPVLDLGNDVDACDGDTVTLDAGAGFASYTWSTTATTQTEVATGSGTWDVTVDDGQGCAQSDTITVTFNANPTSSFTSSDNLLVVDFTDASTGGATTYAWDFGDGNSSSSASPQHTFAGTGTYTVCLTVTTAQGCSDTYCEDVTVFATGIEDNAFLSTLSIFPNPAGEFTNIQMSDVPASQISLRVIDVEGRLVVDRMLETSGTLNYQLPVNDLEAGVYFLELVVGPHTTKHQLVIMR